MSDIYVQEPPCEGKICLETTVGEIDIELWSRECPKACRNFIQLCLEGYYDKTKFFRVVPDFIVQGGDPTNTGHGMNCLIKNYKPLSWDNLNQKTKNIHVSSIFGIFWDSQQIKGLCNVRSI